LQRQLQRLQAPRSLIAFTEFTLPRYDSAGLHRQIAEQLERVERGEIDRLMLLVPPRHGKSELASRRFPAWFLGRDPTRHFISASASFSLAEEFGRDVRNLVRSEEFMQVFDDVRLAEDSQARGRWNTEQGGSYYAVGVGGSLYGRGAHVLLIDDPFSSMADARSEHVRKETWQWFTGTAYNRLEKNGAIVVIGHRTHQDDLQGRLLAQQAAGGDRWEVVELKALDDKGQALWPEKYDVDALQRIKQNTSAADWSALYNQSPIAEEGQYFREDWIVPTLDIPLPSRLRLYGASDFAVSSKESADYTVHVVLGLDSQLRLYLVDMWRRKTSSAEWVEAFCDMVQRWRPALWALEKGQITSGVGPFLRTRMRERRCHTGLEEFPVRHDKAVRAQSIRGRMELRGGLYVPAKASWLSDLKAELLAFPTGRHDDIVDALGLAGQLVDKWCAGPQPMDNVVRFRRPEDFKDYCIESELERDSGWTWKML